MLNHRPTFTFNADISFSYILKASLIKLTLFSLAFYPYLCSDLQHMSHIVSFAWCQSLNEQKAALLSAADPWIEMDSTEQKSIH